MAKSIFITGGAASGKTRWAITYFEMFDNVLYLCVSDEVDKDSLSRIQFSNKKNGIEWDVRTGVTNPTKEIDRHKFCIFDNLGAYVSNAIKARCQDTANITKDEMHNISQEIIKEITDLMYTVQDIDGNIIIISLETGLSVCPQDKEQLIFREILGAVNQRIANICSDVYMSVSGIQFKIKG